jgi:hypothetical protein
MAVVTEQGKHLVLLALRLNWKRQTGLELRLDQNIGGVIMSLAHVDELIAELISCRDVIERENKRREDSDR